MKGYVKEHLARYKVPRDVEFMDELPRNATGKVLKRELEEVGMANEGESAADSARSPGGSSGIGLAIAGRSARTATASRSRRGARTSSRQAVEGAARRRASTSRRCRPTWPTRRTSSASWPPTRERFGRLDVLVNNAGVGIGGAIADAETKKLDMQLDVNLRAVYLMTRECIPMLKEAGAEHGKALVVNTASIAGKYGQGWLAAYSATKFGVVGPDPGHATRSSATDGIQVTALCPGFVATPMTDWVEGGAEGGDDPARGHRRGACASCCAPPRVHRAGDPVHPARRRDVAGASAASW